MTELPEWEVEVGYVGRPDGFSLIIEVGDNWRTTIDTREPTLRARVHTISGFFSYERPRVVVRGDGELTSLIVREVQR